VEIYANFLVEMSGGEPGEKTKLVFSKWIFRAVEAATIAGRFVSRFKRAARMANWDFDMKDDPLFGVGDFVTLNSADVLVKSGTATARGTTNWQIIQKTDDRKNGKISIQALEARGARYAIITAAGYPVYSAATAYQRQWGFIGTATPCVMSDGSEGYAIL
jgi:hypothetical protein